MIQVPETVVHGSEFRGEVYTTKLTIRASTSIESLDEGFRQGDYFEKLRQKNVEEIWDRLYGDIYQRLEKIIALYEMGYRFEVLLALQDLEKDVLALRGSSDGNGTRNSSS